MPATIGRAVQDLTFVKISPANFLNSTVKLNAQFIAEATEYFVNPFETGNPTRIASGIIDFNLYN